jgi:hypothetical protein
MGISDRNPIASRLTCLSRGPQGHARQADSLMEDSDSMIAVN